MIKREYISAVSSDVVKFIVDIPFYIYLMVTTVISGIVSLVPNRRKCLDGETILVTGAASGIGRQVVLQIAQKAKPTFVLWDVNKAGLDDVTNECEKFEVTVFPYVVDLSNRQNIAKTAQKVRSEVGPVTMLFNNAGIGNFSSFLSSDPLIEEKIIKVNLLAVMTTIHEFLPDMVRRKKGHVISTCSGLGHFRSRMLSSYVASKFGLRGFMDTLRLEMAIHPEKPHIKVTTIYPGWVNTPMTKHMSLNPRYKTCFGPTMEPDYVGRKIIDGIEKGLEEIYIPKNLKMASIFLNLVPAGLLMRLEDHIMFKNFSSDPSIKPTATRY